jgi:hypothetical protein
LNCSSVHSAATPCANIPSEASGQKDFTNAKAWLTHATGTSARNLTTLSGAPRSRSSRGCLSASPSSAGATISTSVWAASLRISSSFSRRPFSSPSVLICQRQSANYSSVSATAFCSLSTSFVRRYSIFFTLVSSSSLYFKVFLSSAVKIFSVSKETR